MSKKRLGKNPLDESRPVSQNIVARDRPPPESSEYHQIVKELTRLARDGRTGSDILTDLGPRIAKLYQEATMYVSIRSADGTEACLVSDTEWASNPVHHTSASGSPMIVTARFHAPSWEEAKRRHEEIQYPSTVTKGEICERCRISVPSPGQTQPPRCAFLSPTFSTDNWSCRTMSVLRRASRDQGAHVRSIDHSVGVVPIPFELSEPTGNDIQTHIVLQWYKDRGRTNQAVIVDGEGNFELLTRELAEKLADHYEKAIQGVTE